MKTKIAIFIVMLFNIISCFAQGGESKINHTLHGILNENILMETWYKFEYKMFEAFRDGEDSIQNVDKEYLDVMIDYKRVEVILFNQLMKNEVPMPFFASDCAEAGIILGEIAECTAKTIEIVTQSPVDVNSLMFATKSQIQIGIRIADIFKQTSKALISEEENLRDNKYREDIVIKAIQNLREVNSRASDVTRILQASKNIAILNQNN